jgi:hypothetical protein
LQEDSGATHNTTRRSWWPVLVSIPSLGDEEDSCRSGRCQVEVATCIDGRQGQTPEADQWGRREEGADDRDGPTLELNLCGLFLAGASVGTRSMYLGRGQVGVELEEGEERRVGGWPRAQAQPVAVRSIRVSLSTLADGGEAKSSIDWEEFFYCARRGGGETTRERRDVDESKILDVNLTMAD